ncbi:hypothetical protein [Desulfoferrobacter suflitae]|uniref:hypothetical protein n=1 Tax=Desulfoferrobacter suflitae TaxID=2865782 RepID=UPI00216488C6|nr:hypothetical protein [Desulfoferrobacter suflitae]MCK8603687.1 hypothetical protein [Desulfoferrobacter suflitae]
MIRPKIEKTDNSDSQAIPTSVPQSNDNFPLLCGPGCACGKATKTSKLKIVIMLVVLAAVAIALIYRRTI